MAAYYDEWDLTRSIENLKGIMDAYTGELRGGDIVPPEEWRKEELIEMFEDEKKTALEIIDSIKEQIETVHISNGY